MATLSSAVSAAASALSVERTRIEAAVSNIANAESTRSVNGEPYRRRDVVVRAEPTESFHDALGRSTATGVKVTAVVEDQSDFRRRYEPSHPDADKDGFVLYPNIDLSIEFVNALEASRAYEANVTTMDVTKSMMNATLRLLA